MANKVQTATPSITDSTDADEHRNAKEQKEAKRVQMNKYFSKPIDAEFAAVNEWCDSALKLSAQAERLETQEVEFIQARELLDQREGHMVAAHELGFKLLSEVVHALKGITEDDLGIRLQNLVDQVDPTPSTHSAVNSDSKIKPFRDEATHIRKEISYREGLKAQIRELEQELEVTVLEKKNLTLLTAKMKRDNKKLKDLLRARVRGSMKLFGKLKTLEGRYEWLTKYANNLVGITREVVFVGDDLEEERKLVRMVKSLEGM